QDAWAYRNAAEDGQLYGPVGSWPGGMAGLFENADLLVNLTGATVLCEEHLAVPVRLYLETDPVLPQVELARGRPFTVQLLSAHTHLATFGENVGRPGCRVPVTAGFDYLPTRQPVVLEWWRTPEPPGARYTTVAKDQNVRLGSGWFSARSACYLASGRPVVTQDTGFGDVLPTGQGLFSFRDMDDIVTAIEAIEADLDKHSQAAVDIAESYFRA